MLSNYYYLQANILCKIQPRNNLGVRQPYTQAFKNLSEAKRLAQRKYDPYGYIASDFELEILYTYALAYFAGDHDITKNNFSIVQVILRHLVVWFGQIHKQFPSIASTLFEIVGKDFWEVNKSRLDS